MLRSGARHPDVGPSSPKPGSSTAPAQQPDVDVAMLQATLNEYLLLEHKFQPKLCLPAESDSGEVTTGARDGAAHVLRCLKVWHDLPADVLIDAINLFDRFLTKMKVRPCHVPCITVACMNIALDKHACVTNTPRQVSVEELVSVSQSACTSGDVSRMSGVMCDKLGLAPTGWVTVVQWTRVFARLLSQGGAQTLLPDHHEIEKLLEVLVCDSHCANARTCELALVVLYYKIEQKMVELTSQGAAVPEDAYDLFEFGAQLQAHCRMFDASLVQVGSRVRAVVARYSARAAAPVRQRLVWRLSTRTLKVLRPTDRLTSLLPTIEEQHLAVDATPNRNRSGSESSEGEDTSDWPRSPVLPVYCDN